MKAKYSYDYRDARVAVFTKCASTMNTAFIGFVLIRDELLIGQNGDTSSSAAINGHSTTTYVL